MRLRFSRAARLLAAIAAVCAVGCGSETADPAPANGSGAVDDGLPSVCNPLRAAGACLLPFPSAMYLEPDASTATGFRVALSADVFPKNALGIAYDPARLERADGFSPNAPLLAYFPERIDPASLPFIRDPAPSLAPGSATVIVDMQTGERVAHFAEVDAQAINDEDRQALILRPMARLAGGRRYAAAVTRAARTLAGTPPASPPGWEAIAAGTATDPAAAKQAERMPAIFEALAAAGVPRADVVLAWDFVTASDDSLTATMRAMRERTLALLDDDGLGYTIESIEEDFSDRALRRVRGTFTVPKFLTETDPAVADTTLVFDEQGLPVADGTYEAPFTFLLPRAAESGTVRLLQFGHGFLGTGEGELGDAGGSYVQDFADEHGYAMVATDWTGLSAYEGVDADGSGAAAKAVDDINYMPWITDRLHQALVNAMVLSRTARAIARDPALYVGGAKVVDDSRVDFYGISLGGVMGSALLGFAPDLERGVLNVGAAGWSTLLQRSTNWALFKLIIDGSYPDPLDQQVLIQVLQAHFDPVDGMSIAPRVLQNPLEGNPPKQVLLQMAVNDPQVANVATEMLARTMGLPLLDDSPKAIFGLTPTPGPLSSALTVWDTKEEAPPDTNTPASVATSNKSHGTIRALPALMEQIDGFFRAGEVVSTCDGVCDPE